MNSTSVVSILVSAGLVTTFAPVRAIAQQPNTFRVYASNLEGPRGLTFGSDGYLYVAEAGTGGTNPGGVCPQVPTPIGPYTGGPTARISKIATDGTRTTVAAGFPSALSPTGSVLGVADVTFMDGTLYALIAGGGCSHGNVGSPNGVAKVNRNTGQWNVIADLGDYLKTHPARYESTDDFEPDGTFYGMIAVDGLLYAMEPNHGQLFSVSKSGDIKQVIDISASEGHIVPTSLAERNGSFYVGNLNLFPIDPQWSRILNISTGGRNDDPAPGFAVKESAYHIVSSKAGFTTVVAVDFGPDGLLYALELSDSATSTPTGGAGKVVRVTHSGDIEDVITGLSVPTGMTFGPDGRLYISNFGAAPAGAGQILQFDIEPGW